MSEKTRVPAIEGWFTTEGEPRLLGTRCTSCGSVFFPKETVFCKNPGCEGAEFEETPLSRTGTLWSYTNNCYKPPAPYIPPNEGEFVPYAIAAVELDAEKMVVLGQVAGGLGVEALKVGMKMELVVETLYQTESDDVVVWKWKPAG